MFTCGVIFWLLLVWLIGGKKEHQLVCTSIIKTKQNNTSHVNLLYLIHTLIWEMNFSLIVNLSHLF